jgi:hypothetical protein
MTASAGTRSTWPAANDVVISRVAVLHQQAQSHRARMAAEITFCDTAKRNGMHKGDIRKAGRSYASRSEARGRGVITSSVSAINVFCARFCGKVAKASPFDRMVAAVVQCGRKLRRRDACESSSDLRQHRFLDGFCGLRGRQPLDFALVLFGPFSALSPGQTLVAEELAVNAPASVPGTAAVWTWRVGRL